MKRIKTYTRIWQQEKVIYALNDLKLPFPIPVPYLKIFGIVFVVFLAIGDFIPIDSIIIKNIVAPAGVTCLLRNLKFDGKEPVKFMANYLAFLIREKKTVRYKKLRLRKFTLNHEIYIRGGYDG